MAAELLDGDQKLHGGDAELRHQLRRLQQGAQRNQHGADARQRHRDLHPLHAVRHDQPDPCALADTRCDERGGQGAGGVVELGVGDSRLRVDDHRLVAVLFGAEPHQPVDGVRHRTPSAGAACRPCRWTARVCRNAERRQSVSGSCTRTVRALSRSRTAASSNSAPSSNAMTAATSCPRSGSGRPSTCATVPPVTLAIARSTSAGATLAPAVLIIAPRAADEVDEAVGVGADEIAGVKPAVGVEALLAAALVVPLHHVRPADAQLRRRRSWSRTRAPACRTNRGGVRVDRIRPH